MQIIYLGPFILLSFGGAAVCLAIPRWRRYALTAAVAPLAFGICSIVGLLVMVLAVDHSGLKFPVILGYLTALVIYFLSGAVGTVLAASIVARVRGWFLKDSSLIPDR
jgi:hypothetical protein